MMKNSEQMEDADIKAAMTAVASYSAARHKRDLLNRMAADLEPEISQARLSGGSIDTTDLFLRLAEKYAS